MSMIPNAYKMENVSLIILFCRLVQNIVRFTFNIPLSDVTNTSENKENLIDKKIENKIFMIYFG
jgi:hypothetical protein